MRDPERIKRILPLLEKVWEAHPDYRLGQLIAAYAPRGFGIWYMEDDALEKELAAAAKKLAERKAEK